MTEQRECPLCTVFLDSICDYLSKEDVECKKLADELKKKYGHLEDPDKLPPDELKKFLVPLVGKFGKERVLKALEKAAEKARALKAQR